MGIFIKIIDSSQAQADASWGRGSGCQAVGSRVAEPREQRGSAGLSPAGARRQTLPGVRVLC